MTNPTVYAVEIQHWDDGEIIATVNDVGDSADDRKSVAYALRRAADLVESGEPVNKTMFS